jgi:hypothetical protein
MLTHLPVNGDGSWATAQATETYGADVMLAEPGRTFEI